MEAVSSYSSEVNVSPIAVLSVCAEMLLLRGHWSANKDRCDGSISSPPAHLHREPSCQQDLGPAHQVPLQQEQPSLALMGNKPLRISLCRGEASVSVDTHKHKHLQDFSSWISPPGFLHQDSPSLLRSSGGFSQHTAPLGQLVISQSEPADGFNDETAAGLLSWASPAAQQLSLGVTRTVSSENPWDLVLTVTRMAPSAGFFQAASPQPCVTDHVQECGSAL